MAKSPIYPRISQWADASHGEDLFCIPCREVNAICPDCGATVCVFCEDNCRGCGVTVFDTGPIEDALIFETEEDNVEVL